MNNLIARIDEALSYDSEENIPHHVRDLLRDLRAVVYGDVLTLQQVESYIGAAPFNVRAALVSALFEASQSDDGDGLSDEALSDLVKAGRALEDAASLMRAVEDGQ